MFELKNLRSKKNATDGKWNRDLIIKLFEGIKYHLYHCSFTLHSNMNR